MIPCHSCGAALIYAILLNLPLTLFHFRSISILISFYLLHLWPSPTLLLLPSPSFPLQFQSQENLSPFNPTNPTHPPYSNPSTPSSTPVPTPPDQTPFPALPSPSSPHKQFLPSFSTSSTSSAPSRSPSTG